MEVNETTLINYIKKNYKKVIFNPLKLNNENKSTALGFIISNNKLVLGFINKSGELCKMINPIDLSNLSNEKFIEIVKRIPLINGYDKKDKENLLLLLENVENISKNKNKKVLEQLNDIISKKEESRLGYNIIINDLKKDKKESDNNFILTKQKYESSLDMIKNNYNKELEEYKNKIINLENVQNECTNRLINDKEYILEGIKNYKEETNNYINNVIEDATKMIGQNNGKNKKIDVIDLTNMYSKLLFEKKDIETKLNILLEKEKEKEKVDDESENKLIESEKKIEKLNLVINEIKSELNQVKENLSKTEIENKINQIFTEECVKKLLEEKEDIIIKIKNYNKEWLNWVNEFYEPSLMDAVKNKMRKELGDILDNFKKIYLRKDKYIENLDIENNEKDKLNRQLKENMSKIKEEIKNTIQEQIMELNKKINLNKERSINIKMKNINENESNNVRNELLKIKELLLIQNINMFYKLGNDEKENCKMLYNKFSTMNNTFYRKKEIIKILDSIIFSNDKDKYFNKLNELIRDKIKKQYNEVRNNINKHIDFLNLDILIDDVTDLTPEICEQLKNNLMYWNANEKLFKIYDDILNDIYDDLSNNIKIILINNKSIEINNNILNISRNMNEKVKIECELNKKIYKNFDEIIDLNINEKEINSVINKLEEGYSSIIINYGIQETNVIFDNLKCNYKVKYIFEQYVKTFLPKSGKINGNIINLVNNVPQLNKFSIDERDEFSKNLELNLRSIKNKDMKTLFDYINVYRKSKKRINKIPEQLNSSRSNLYIVLECIFENGVVSYLTICLLTLKESPIEIYNTITTKSKGKFETNKNCISSEYIEYENYFGQLLKEGFYINETINHLLWFLNNKKDIKSKINIQEISVINPLSEVNYNKDNYYINPLNEENSIDQDNNCLTIPIFKFLETISVSKQTEYKSIKYICILEINKDNNCNKTIETLEFSNKINI